VRAPHCAHGSDHCAHLAVLARPVAHATNPALVCASKTHLAARALIYSRRMANNVMNVPAIRQEVQLWIQPSRNGASGLATRS
jgi:hypothetical protein